MKQISYKKLEVWKEEGKAFELLDVREPWEHEAFNIGGRLIPLGELMSRKAEIETSGKPLVVYCKRGVRSMIAIQRLSPHIKDLEMYNLSNGVYDLMY